jgi:hypothetical protein
MNTNDVSLKEYLEKLIAEQDKRAALALAALNKNRSETISILALLVSLVTAAAVFLRK